MALCMQSYMFTKLVFHLWRTAEKSTMWLSSLPTSLPNALRGRETCRRWNIIQYLSYFNRLHSEFSCGPAANTFLFVAPPEAESQSRESCVPLETSPVNHRDVRGLHLHQGGAPQWCAALHESVSLLCFPAVCEKFQYAVTSCSALYEYSLFQMGNKTRKWNFISDVKKYIYVHITSGKASTASDLFNIHWMKPFFPCSSQDGRQMIYLPLLLVNELSFRVRDLVVGAISHTLPDHFNAGFWVEWLWPHICLCQCIHRRSAAARLSSLWLCPTRESL